MSTFDMFYLGMVIGGMVLFIVVLAWATIYSRDVKTVRAPRSAQVRPTPAQSTPVPSTPAKRPTEPGQPLTA